MSGNSTTITDPIFVDKESVEPKTFTFDYSYWSHDGFGEREDGYLYPVEPKYADQVLPNGIPGTRQRIEHCLVPRCLMFASLKLYVR